MPQGVEAFVGPTYMQKLVKLAVRKFMKIFYVHSGIRVTGHFPDLSMWAKMDSEESLTAWPLAAISVIVVRNCCNHRKKIFLENWELYGQRGYYKEGITREVLQGSCHEGGTVPQGRYYNLQGRYCTTREVLQGRYCKGVPQGRYYKRGTTREVPWGKYCTTREVLQGRYYKRGTVLQGRHSSIISPSLVRELGAGFPRSWKILENIAVMESHGKVLEYENFPKSHGK